MAEISKITLPDGSSYNIKDTTARAEIEALAKIGVDIKVESTLPQASEDTMNSIYLVPSSNSSYQNTYDEYLTIKRLIMPNFYGYSWEKIGSTAVDLTNYVNKKTDGVSLDFDTYSATTGVAIADHTASIEGLSAEASFVPQGTISAPTLDVSLNREQVYIAVSKTSEGSVTAGTIGTAAECVLPVLTTSVSEETLTIGWTEGSFTANTPTTPTSVTMPRFSAKSLVTSLGYARAEAPVFTGEETTVTLNPTASVTISPHEITDNGHTHYVLDEGTFITKTGGGVSPDTGGMSGGISP